MGILRTIIIILIIYYGFRFLTKYIFPFLLKNWMEKKMNEFQNQSQQQFKEQQKAQQFAKEHEGEVKIKTKPSKNRQDTDGVGDFVDYEEVE